EAGAGERGAQLVEGVGVVGEAVEEEHQRPGARPGVAETKATGQDGARGLVGAAGRGVGHAVVRRSSSARSQSTARADSRVRFGRSRAGGSPRASPLRSAPPAGAAGPPRRSAPRAAPPAAALPPSTPSAR